MATMSSLPSDPAERHRAVAGRFTDLVRGVSDWDAPTPVSDWAARDVVRHLVEWFPAFIESGSDVRLQRGPSVDEDPVASWEAQAAAVQAVLDDPGAAGGTFSNPHTGEFTVDRATDRFYTADLFMHTWDLARSTGQADALDAGTCAEMLAGMQPIEELIRSSGQYGAAVDVPGDASPQDRLLGFIGRDPAWRPPAG
jgi:uncharacterized protein (TIGR03086 family)